jgi:hypothetical protein
MLGFWWIYFFTELFWNEAANSPPLVSIYPKLSKYYYTSLQNKFQESISINLCNNQQHISPQIQMSLISPSLLVREQWNHIQSLEIYHGASASLCQSQQLKNYLLQFGACFRPPSRPRVLKPIRAVSHFHTDHPRCHRTVASSHCAPDGKIFVIRPNQIAFEQFPFLLNTTIPIITSRSGMLLTLCGVLGLFNSCKAHSYSLYATFLDGPSSQNRNATLCYPSPPLHCPFPSVKILFIASQNDDTQIGQV